MVLTKTSAEDEKDNEALAELSFKSSAQTNGAERSALAFVNKPPTD